MRTTTIVDKEKSDAKIIKKVKRPAEMTVAFRDDLLLKLAKLHGLIEE